MFSAFRMSPAGSGRGLCDIDSPEKVKNIKKCEVGGIKQFIIQILNFELSPIIYRSYLAVPGLSKIFDIFLGYRYHTVRVRSRPPNPYEMLKI